MNIITGQVKEVFIPKTEDELNPENIGFNVLVSDKILKIIVPVDEETSAIYKDDYVNIIEHILQGKTYFDIEKVEDDE